MSLRDQILGTPDLKKELVEVPEWPDAGPLYVREMSGKERLAFETTLQAGDANAVTMAVAFTICDEAGNLIFGAEDAPAIAEKNAKVIRRIYDAAIALNRVEKEAVEEEGKK